MRRHPRKKKKNKKQAAKFASLSLFLFAFSLTLMGLYGLDKKFMPIIQEISHARTMMIANQMIDATISETLKESNLSESDLLLPNLDDTNGFRANTPLLSDFCVTLSKKINEEVVEMEREIIEVPMGAATNLHYFANKGPRMNFSLLPAGSALVDYETAFVSTGINQMNYKIWVTIALDVKIVNPVYKETIHLTRKVMVVDTVFGGEVPNYYFNINKSGDIY